MMMIIIMSISVLNEAVGEVVFVILWAKRRISILNIRKRVG